MWIVSILLTLLVSFGIISFAPLSERLFYSAIAIIAAVIIMGGFIMYQIKKMMDNQK